MIYVVYLTPLCLNANLIFLSPSRSSQISRQFQKTPNSTPAVSCCLTALKSCPCDFSHSCECQKGDPVRTSADMGVTNRTDNEHELQDLFCLRPPSHTSYTPPLSLQLNWTSCLRQAAHSLGCFRGNSDHRDGHTVYNPAPHLGYELANQGLSTLVMGPMTMPHLGSRPFDLQGLRSTDSGCKERLVDEWE